MKKITTMKAQYMMRALIVIVLLAVAQGALLAQTYRPLTGTRINLNSGYPTSGGTGLTLHATPTAGYSLTFPDAAPTVRQILQVSPTDANQLNWVSPLDLYTFTNGLTEVAPNTVKFGGTLIEGTTLNVDGNALAFTNSGATSTLTIGGGGGTLNVIVQNQATFNGNVDANSGLDVTGANLTVGSTMFTVAVGSGNTSIAGTLAVTGNATLSSTTSSTSTGTGALIVTGGVGIGENLNVGGNLAITGTSTLTGNVDANGGLDVLGGNLTVGTTKFTVAHLTGNTSIAGTLAVTGATALTGNADANGGLDVSGGDFTQTGGNATFNVNGYSMSIAGLSSGTLSGATPDDILLITPSPNNVVKRTTIANLIGAEQGITYNESNSGKLRLGGAANTDAVFASNRFINQGNYALNFTYDLGGTTTTMLQLNDGTATVNAVTNISGATSITGNTSIAGTLTQTGSSNQVEFAGNVNATNGLDVTNADLTVGATNFVVDVATGTITTAGDVLPLVNDSKDLGSTSNRWKDVYIGPSTLHIGTSTAELAVSYNNASSAAFFNVGGGASELVVTTSTFTVGNAAELNGNVTIGNATADVVTISGTIAGGSPLVFEGATSNAFQTTLTVTDPTAARTIALPNASGTFLVNAGEGMAATAAGSIDLGALSSSANAFTVDRYINVDNQILRFTDENQASIVTIDGGTQTLTLGVAAGTGEITGLANNVKLTGQGSALLQSETGTTGVKVGYTGSKAVIENVQTAGTYNKIEVGTTTVSMVVADGGVEKSGLIFENDGTYGFTGSMAGNTPLVFEGATTDAHKTSFFFVEPTATRTITFPDQSGTVLLSGNLGSLVWEVGGNTITGAGAVRKIGIATQGSNDDALAIMTDGDDRLTITAAGAATFSGSLTSSGAFTANDAVTLGNGNDNVSINAGSGTFEVASSGVDISTTGAISSVTTLGMSSTLTNTAATNQIVLGTGTTTTINAVAPSSSVTYSIPDAGGNASFVMTAGTQTVGGAKTFSSALSVSDNTTSTSSSTGALKVTGGAGIGENLYVGGTLNATGNTVLSGTLGVTGTASLNGAVNLGDGASDVVTFNGTIAGGSPLVFEGATSNAHQTTFAITEPTATRTITFPDQSGTVMMTNGTGDLTLTGSLTVEGNTILGNANSDQTTIYGTTPLVFEGTTASSFTTSVAVSGPTANNTITLPDASGTFLINAGPGLTASAAGTVNLGATNDTDGALTASRNVNLDAYALTFQRSGGTDILKVDGTNTDGSITLGGVTTLSRAVNVPVQVNAAAAGAVTMDNDDFVIVQKDAANVTLPDGAAGRMVIIRNAHATTDINIVAFDADDEIDSDADHTGVDQITLAAGASIQLVYSGSYWYQIGN